MDKYKEAFERNEIDINLLCSALGKQSIDEKFM
jgi:hypothetical protein